MQLYSDWFSEVQFQKQSNNTNNKKTNIKGEDMAKSADSNNKDMPKFHDDLKSREQEESPNQVKIKDELNVSEE